MRIRYSKTALGYSAHKPCHFAIEYFKTRFTRNGCAHQGVSEDALDRAEADPGTWIECEREEAPPPSVRTESEVIADLAEQRDRLLAALVDLLDEQNGPPLVSQEESWDIAMTEATATIEDTKQKMDAARAEAKT